MRDRIEKVAATDFTVLIEGESGTGKELVARQIHELSRRRRAPFVAVNCAAIVETLLEAELFGIEDRTATGVRGRRGKFEHAHDGTLFLDEVSDLSAAAQAKLLRAIQDLSVERVGGYGARRVDTRIIVASNRSLLDLVEQKRFRLDLFYRLNGVEVQVPPLRCRRDDILELARYFLERHRAFRPLSLSTAAADALLTYDWPGNVRELERVVERGVALASGSMLELDDLPPALLGGYADALVPALQARSTMRAWASRYARLVLERCGNNKRKTCRELQISYHTLQAYLRSDKRKPMRRRIRRAGDGQADSESLGATNAAPASTSSLGVMVTTPALREYFKIDRRHDGACQPMAHRCRFTFSNPHGTHATQHVRVRLPLLSGCPIRRRAKLSTSRLRQSHPRTAWTALCRFRPFHPLPQLCFRGPFASQPTSVKSARCSGAPSSS